MLRHSSPYCFRGTSFCFCVSTGTMACVRITLHSLNYSFSEQPRYPPSFHSKRSSSKLFKNPNFRINYGTSVAKPLQFSASSTVGAPNEGLKVPSPSLVGENDLLIVGPGVLGRIVAEQWRKENPECQVLGQTMTTDHHEELVKIGITPSLREVKPTHQFPFVIFCAPPSKSEDYTGDVKLAASNWSGKGSFLFTSSSALFDCNDNGPCDEDSPVVPMGRSPRTDILLETEKVVLDIGGCVLRLAGLYISLIGGFQLNL
ncbi:hypothetical protein NE237_030817 [Protea cynaroides]|uniref:Uncharacterized protein n=1 Tax=Protea cynaroides TaxID=273540 RepID=A0A9Q0GUY0_9MAGN|nr:hypothetical protein NE237_030817 [Protea cynaroides]